MSSCKCITRKLKAASATGGNILGSCMSGSGSYGCLVRSWSKLCAARALCIFAPRFIQLFTFVAVSLGFSLGDLLGAAALVC